MHYPWILGETTVYDWMGVLIGWALLIGECALAYRLLARFGKEAYWRIVATYLVVGCAFATVIIWLDVANRYGATDIRTPGHQLFAFVFVELLWPVYVPMLPYITSCAYSMLTRDLRCS